jgi:hypothetical protein
LYVILTFCRVVGIHRRRDYFGTTTGHSLFHGTARDPDIFAAVGWGINMKPDIMRYRKAADVVTSFQYMYVL